MTANDRPEEVGIGELCVVVRTKNAGPFLFALDLMFRDAGVYHAVKRQGLVNRETIARAYGVTETAVVNFEYYDEVFAIKAVLRRPFVAGSPGDPDCYSMNQEVPALRIRLPLSLLPEDTHA
jgi:Domain of unknown function (DUF4387)